MKILMPVLHYWPVIGGLETWTQNIAERLSQRAEVFIVTGKVHPVKSCPAFGRAGAAALKAPPQFNRVKIFRTSLFSLQDLSHSSWFYIFTTLPFIFFRSLKIIKKEKIDILHCQGFLSCFLGCLLGFLTKTPFIATVQRMENKAGLKKLVYGRASCCIAASSAIKRYFQEIGCQNIKVIPNGIALQRFKNLDREKSRQNLGIKGEFVIMTVARLEKIKGIDYLIKAIRNIQTRSLDISDIVLIIIGDGSQRKALENLVNILNLEDRVKFLGRIPNTEIPQYLVAADCFVLPSVKEGFGIAILEAQAASLPVVATNVGGIPNIIESGKTGILVEPKEPKAIARALIKICSEEKFSKELARKAKINLINYDWENIAQKVYDVYQDILK